MIGIAIDQPILGAGEFLTGTIHWVAEGNHRASRIIARAEWETGGEGNRACGVGRATQWVVKDAQRDGVFPLRMLIPYEGPITFEGELITLIWKLKVRVDRRGFDEFSEVEFRVEPRR